MNSLEGIHQRLPLPESAVSVPPAAWDIEARLGVAFPDDYKAFLADYGRGSIATATFPEGYLHLCSPDHPWKVFDLERAIWDVRDQLRDLASEKFRGTPYHFPDSPDHVIPWGVSINGDHYVWLIDSVPWQVAVVPRQGGYQRCPWSFSGALAHFLAGTFSLDEELLFDGVEAVTWAPHLVSE